MKIGIDIDEVLAEFVRGYYNFYKLKSSREIKFEDTFSYNLWEVMRIPRDEAFKIADEFYDSELFDNVVLVAGAKEGLTALARDNELSIITSRPARIKTKTEQFLSRNYPGIPLRVIYAGDIFKNQGKTKAEICSDLSLDLFIEDNLKYARECAEKGIRVFLLDKPWNQQGVNGKISRVKNWQEILENLAKTS